MKCGGNFLMDLFLGAFFGRSYGPGPATENNLIILGHLYQLRILYTDHIRGLHPRPQPGISFFFPGIKLARVNSMYIMMTTLNDIIL